MIAQGFQTFGEDYKIDTDSKDIVVRLKHPSRQYSTYEHTGAQAASTSSGDQGSSAKPSDPQPAPKQ